MNDKELNTAVNPTSNTAIRTLIMAYVSSAGLRVLLMMYKSLEDKDRFELKGVNDAVREILETTGFDQFLLKDNFD